jgi:hypothetical protein
MVGCLSRFKSRFQLPPKPYFYFAQITSVVPPNVIGRFVWTAKMSATPAPSKTSFDAVVDGVPHPLLLMTVNPTNHYEFIFWYNGSPPAVSWRIRYHTYDPNVISEDGVRGRFPWVKTGI